MPFPTNNKTDGNAIDTSENKPIGVSKKSFLGQCKNLVKEFMGDLDLPPWYRGISAFQKAAGDRLFPALRDDAEQETTHRTRQCLLDIGLNPMISNKSIKRLMRLSHNNDLAFLWFLLEAHYKPKDKDRGEYDLNQQLIMSVIVHLDLIPTLRELDRVLPPGVETEKKDVDIMANLMRKRQKEKEAKALEEKRKRKLKFQEAKNISPYLKKLTRPKPYGKTLFLKEPRFRVKIYDSYKNPFHVVQNMSNRWFATYEPQTLKRITNKIVTETVDNMMSAVGITVGMDNETTNSKKSIPQEEEDHLRRIVRLSQQRKILSVIDKVGKSDEYPAMDASLCVYHQRAKELESSLRTDLMDIVAVTCRKMEAIDKAKDEARLKRMRDELESNVNCFLHEFRRMAGKPYEIETSVDVLQSNNCCGCYNTNECDCLNEKNDFYSKIGSQKTIERNCRKCNLAFKTMDLCCGRSSTLPEENNNNTLHNLNSVSSSELCATIKHYHLKSNDFGRSKNCKQQCKHIRDVAKPARNKVSPRRSRDVRISILSKLDDNLNKNHNSMTGSTFLPLAPSQVFYKAPTDYTPHQFDYFNIFRKLKPLARRSKSYFSTQSPDDLIKEEDVKNLCLKALSSHHHMCEHLHPTISPNFDDIINTQMKESIAEAAITHKLKDKQRPLKPSYGDVKLPLTFDRTHYDPEDSVLMRQMLKQALKFVSRDKRFVLASVSDAYKLPILMHFITRRYGQSYTSQQRHESMQESLKVFRALNRMATQLPAPDVNDAGNNDFVSYGCRDYLLHMASKIKFDYYRLLNQAILEQSRTFWFAMRPFLCTGGPPRNTFYAYMPSRPSDINRFNVWKPSEYRNARQAWEDRLRQKRKILFR